MTFEASVPNDHHLDGRGAEPHVAEAHHRELPEIVRAKSREVDDPDQRVLAMLGARVDVTDVRGSGVAVSPTSTSESSTKSAA